LRVRLRASRRAANRRKLRRPPAESRQDIRKHLAGETTIAIRVADDNGLARLFAFDLDRRGPERAGALFGLGQRGLTDAALAAEGSDVDRAKVVVFIATPDPALTSSDPQAAHGR